MLEREQILKNISKTFGEGLVLTEQSFERQKRLGIGDIQEWQIEFDRRIRNYSFLVTLVAYWESWRVRLILRLKLTDEECRRIEDSMFQNADIKRLKKIRNCIVHYGAQVHFNIDYKDRECVQLRRKIVESGEISKSCATDDNLSKLKKKLKNAEKEDGLLRVYLHEKTKWFRDIQYVDVEDSDIDVLIKGFKGELLDSLINALDKILSERELKKDFIGHSISGGFPV